MNRPIRTSLRGASLAVSLLLVSLPSARAQSDPGALGAGVQTCSKMYELYRKKLKSNRKVAPIYQSWFQGFISGMNVANVAHVTKRKPFGIDSSKLREIVEAHCDENPGEDPLTVVVKIYNSGDPSPAQ